MITQAWNIYSFAVPIVQQFFGIEPDAAHKTITIRPRMPSKWATATLEHVTIGENEISVHYKRNDSEIYLRVEQKRPDWTLVLLPEVENSDEIQAIQGIRIENRKNPGVRSRGEAAELKVVFDERRDRK